MNPANEAAEKIGSARRSMLLLAAAVGVCAEVGCATGGQAWRAGAGAMSGMLWSRGRAEPGYDLYAQNMAGSKGVKAAEAATVADRDVRPSDETGTGAALVARDRVQPADVAAEPRPQPRSTSDASVRVTLGRPESLPVLKNPDGEPGPLVASAAPEANSAHVAVTSPAPAESAAPIELAAAPERPPVEAQPEPSPAPAPEAPNAEAAEVAQAEPADEPAAKTRGVTLKSLLDDARGRLESMNTYQVGITRIERVGNQVLPEEKALLSIRRNPKAVRLEWPEGPNKGREVIYSAAINDRVMHVNIANSAIPIPRMSIPVDSPLALRNSRHAITEAGFDTIFNNLSSQVDAQGRPTGAEGRLTYKGLQQAEGMDRPCHLVQRITPTREVWRVYLDPDTLMPVAVTARQADGGLLESYRYEGLKADPTELAAVEAFDPDKRWGEAKGLFSRIAKAAGAAATQPASTTTR
ncbi:DUF1571 domain-containing protein [Paludisphaera mucosa]|uniref:DUF1571 domain-containing protein n=1 Tax=Paludisphaera mucosa TaxID=3030827 RepID=A0ABT6F6D6_9BACT|nr:DUF1571 domain-containing protein [Paludisphaera mucosa]MDG3002974.1 DUF1571 domain-containing protein [Paludisphaera mucosa]